MTRKLILASQSPRRKQLLEWAEVPFEILVKETSEEFPSALSVEEVPVYIADQKAQAVRAVVNGAYNVNQQPLILAADTIVVLGSRIIGKPRSREDAIEILSALSGKTHRVITGVVILDGEQQTAFHDVTEVDFHSLSPEQIGFYIDRYAPYDKAGAYAIQEWIGVVGIKSIRGDFYNVMGLPVSRVVKILSRY